MPGINDLSKVKWENKTVAVLGLGVSNIPLIKYLSRHKANIVACDYKTSDVLGDRYDKLAKYNLEFSLGKSYLDILETRKFDFVFRSPGIRPDLRQILHAKRNGSIITSEIELVFQLAPCDIVGVTGSDGKTTTTTLIALMLEESDYSVHLGGNIGKPLIDEVENYSKEDIIVLELSSFQLMDMKMSPKYSLITNLSPNHLDYHKSYKEYIEAKYNIFAHQSPEDFILYNKDNDNSSRIGTLAIGEVAEFSMNSIVVNGSYLRDGKLYLTSQKDSRLICDVKEVKLLGMHNIENVLAAACVAWKAGANLTAIKKVATSFVGVEHRLEFVREFSGVRYYNDSIASSPTRAIAALNSFNEKVILIAGGSDKYISFDHFGEIAIDKVKHLVLLGQTSEKISTAIKKAMTKGNGKITIYQANSLEEAILNAKRVAKAGDYVLLSPACASFDMFDNFEHRGNLFKEIVNNLK